MLRKKNRHRVPKEKEMSKTIEQVTLSVSATALDLLLKTELNIMSVYTKRLHALDIEITDFEKKAEVSSTGRKKNTYRAVIQSRKNEKARLLRDMRRITALSSLAKSSKKRQLEELQD